MSIYDPVTCVLSNVNYKARKEHRCQECYRQIRVGEIYKKECHIFEGELHVHKTCQHCLKARNYLLDNNGEFGYGFLYEELSDSLFDWKEEFYVCGMRRKWTKKDGSLWKIPNF